jgi:hypothetical protein
MTSTPAVIAAIAVACALWPGSLVARDLSHGFVLAQTSIGGGSDSPPPSPSSPPPLAPVPPPLNLPAPSTPKFDYIPPSPAPAPLKEPPQAETVWWGAIAFTADGSYSSAWKMSSQAEAEAKVAKQCAGFGRGGCEVVTFSGRECAALATFLGRRWKLSFTAGGYTFPEAQNAAINRCNSDERARGNCQPRTAACADGR